MAPRTATRLAAAGFVTTVATLALAAPTAYADPAGGYDHYQESAPVSPAQARMMQDAADAGTSGVSPAQARLMQQAADAGTNISHRATSVHAGSEGPTPAVPDTTTGTTISWDLLPIATGAAGGILLVSLGFALVVVIRRHHEDGMAHPV